MFQLSEKITLLDSGRRTTTDGYMTVNGRVARTGIQKYTGRELGLMDRDFVNVYRPEEEVMKEASMLSFAHKPITDDHPPELVTSDNWQKYAKGMTGERVARDGESIVVPLGLMDAATIANIDGGKQELSAGYTCRLEFVDGVTPDGEKYNAIQRDIRVNHIAVVQKGRAGPSCRLGDASLKPKEVTMTLQTITFDGLSVEVTNQGAQVINALTGRLETSDKALATANTAHAAAIALKDKELGEKDAEIKKLTDAALTPEAIDALVVDRADVITKAKTFGDVDTTGKTNAEIRKAAVTLKVGDAKLVGKSDEYVEALFDTFAANADPVKAKLQNSGKTTVGDGEDGRVSAYDAYLASLNPTDAKEGV